MSENENLDINSLFQQAQALQQQMVEAQQRQADLTINGSSGGGKVTVEMSRSGTVNNISIDPSVVDPEDVEMLEDLLLAALRDAAAKITEIQSETMNGLDMPDLGGLGGLLGGQ